MGCNGSKKDDANRDRKFKADAEKRKAEAGPNASGADGKAGADQKVLKPRDGGGPGTPAKPDGGSGAGAGAPPGGPVTPGGPAASAGGDDVFRSPAKGIATPNTGKPGQKYVPLSARASTQNI